MYKFPGEDGITTIHRNNLPIKTINYPDIGKRCKAIVSKSTFSNAVLQIFEVEGAETLIKYRGIIQSQSIQANEFICDKVKIGDVVECVVVSYGDLDTPVLMKAVGFENYLVAQKLSDFSTNNFYAIEIRDISSNYNVTSTISYYGNGYSIKIGSSFLCVRDNQLAACDYLDSEYGTTNDPAVFYIEAEPFGFKIKYGTKCLSVRNKLGLDTCDNDKEQIFGFEYNPIQRCFSNTKMYREPKTPEEKKENEKALRKLEKLKKENPELYSAIKKDLAASDSFDKFVEATPKLKDKEKMKRLWGSLWDYSFKKRGFGYSLPGFRNIFCTKIF